jgi:hypothetical protein
MLFTDVNMNSSLAIATFQTFRTYIRTFLCKIWIDESFFFSRIPFNQPHDHNNVQININYI